MKLLGTVLFFRCDLLDLLKACATFSPNRFASEYNFDALRRMKTSRD
jgi:hypothetical protein